MRHWLAHLGIVIAFAASCGGQTQAPELWHLPSAIDHEDLLDGLGGSSGRPQGNFTFEKEDMNGSSPKIVVRDSQHVKWTVKMGPEAQPETVASRFVWAAGFFAREDYWLDRIQVQDMPAHLKRGGNLVHDGVIENVRLEHIPDGEKKMGGWKWHANSFKGTRELHALAVLMAVINNWDLKDSNNSVYRDKAGREYYAVSDLGASFGGNGEGLTDARSKGNVKTYETSKFITKATARYVDFATPALPNPLDNLRLPQDAHERLAMRSVTKHIPRADAKWIGSLLGQLSHQQICDAFRAGGYSPTEAEAYAAIVEERIRRLREL